MVKHTLKTLLFIFIYIICLIFLGIYFYSCGSVQKYKIMVNQITSDGWQLDTREVDFPDEMRWMLNAELNRIDECLRSVGKKQGLKRGKLIIKLVEQTYFSACTPEEEFLSEEAPQESCLFKGLEEDIKCPCMWRTKLQDRWHVIIPIQSNFTRVRQFNLWEVIHAHTWSFYWYRKPEAQCIGGCR